MSENGSSRVSKIEKVLPQNQMSLTLSKSQLIWGKFSTPISTTTQPIG